MIWNEPNNKSHWDLEADPGWQVFATHRALAGEAIAAEAPGLPRVLGGISPIDPDFINCLAGRACWSSWTRWRCTASRSTGTTG